MDKFIEILIIALGALIVVAFIRGFKIVPQAKAYVVERLGAYKTTWSTGVHFVVPFIDNVKHLPL